MSAQNSTRKEQNEKKNRQSQKALNPVKAGIVVFCCAAALSALYFANKTTNDTQKSVKPKTVAGMKQVTQQTKGQAGKGSTAKSATTEKPLQKPLTAESTVQEIIAYAESSKDRWDNIAAVGHTGQGHDQNGGNKQNFKVAVEKPDKYWLEEGPSIMVSNGKKQWWAMTNLKRVMVSDVYKMPPEEQARLDKVMAEARKSDPTVSEPGEQIVPAPINDLINPSYIARKELRYNAKSVEKIGVREVAGRKAILIRATFDKIKEDHWDIYVDAATGIFLGLVIVPVSGKGSGSAGDMVGESTFIDKLYINTRGNPFRFDYQIPKGYKIEQPYTPRKKRLSD
jgi:outer membrane lipoprotein-sorting protein